MKPKTLVLMAVAAGCGLVAMLGVQQAMLGKPTHAPVATTKVLVALENIESGVRLTPENTTFKEMATASIQEDAVRTPEDFEERAAKVPFMAGDIIRKTKLTEPGDWGKSVAIPKGMRVISIPVDDTHTISGLLRPGDRIDVLVTYQGPGDRGGRVSKTKTLLEHVEVFATDDLTVNKMDDNGKNARAKNVALLLTPEQAGYVILARSKGSLSLSWRRRGDDELAQTKDIDEKLMEELQGTVGIQENGMNLYGRRGALEETYGSQNVSQFLDENGPENTTPVSVVTPTNPKWTVDVYTGKNVVSQQFDIPDSNTMKKNSGGFVPVPSEP
ncbi:MAG TPA: Flp pilus assembly protein CpaB [Planctomicrobium sp.]|nr:Flp pilus assembly protein CpaB [Planctomicrobium sp.]